MAEKKVEKESLTAEALQSKLENLKKEQMNQRFQHAAGQMPKTHVMRQTRREKNKNCRFLLRFLNF